LKDTKDGTRGESEDVRSSLISKLVNSGIKNEVRLINKSPDSKIGTRIH